MPQRQYEHSAGYNDDTLEAIDKLNFENWMHYNRELVRILYYKPMSGNTLHKDSRFMEGKSLSKLLKWGLESGIFIRTSKKGTYFLTEKARKYYEKHLMEDNT